MHILTESQLDGMPCPNTLIHGECLAAMTHIADKSVDMILCDLPYGTTACKWDTIIPFEPLWAAYKRIINPNGAIVLTASQPFTSALVMSNPKMFRYEWIWQKTNGGGFLNANKMPLKRHENILVFAANLSCYYPQKTPGKAWKRSPCQRGIAIHNGGKLKPDFCGTSADGSRYPSSVQLVSNSNGGGLHPTQKPVALFEYLIRTYTQPGELVLDNCAGSLTTAVACLNTDRRYICIEQDDTYFAKGAGRVKARELELAAALPL